MGAVGGYLIHNINLTPTAEPDLAPIEHYLQGAAEHRLGSPTLSDKVIEIRVDGASLGSEVDRVKNLAIGLGGTAVGDTTATDCADVLAKIPRDAVESFMEAVRNPSKSIPERPETDSAGEVFVEVRLTSAS